MVEQIFVSPQVKRSVTSSYKTWDLRKLENTRTISKPHIIIAQRSVPPIPEMKTLPAFVKFS